MAEVIFTGLNPDTIEPLDSRTVAADEAARFALASTIIYDGLVVYQEDDEKLYVLTDKSNVGSSSGWTEVGSGGGGGGDVTPENVTQALVDATSISTDDQDTIKTNLNITGGGSGSDATITLNGRDGIAEIGSFDLDQTGDLTLNVDVDGTVVRTTGNQDIEGIKHFTSRMELSESATNVVPEVRFIGDGVDQVLGRHSFYFNDTSRRGGLEVHRNNGSGYTMNFDVGQIENVFVVEDDNTIRIGSSGAKVSATDLRNLTELPLLPDGDGTTQKSVLQTVGANGSETYTWVPEPAGADGSGYDKVTINGGTALTQEDTLNFGDEFTGVDGTDATDIGLATTIEGERIFKLGSGEEFKVINADDEELFRVNNTNVEINNNADLILHDDSITNVGDNALRWEYSDLGGDFPAGHHSSFDIKLFSILSGNNDVDLAPQIEFQTNTLRSGSSYSRTGLLSFTRRDSDPDTDSVPFAEIIAESKSSLDSRFVFRVTDDNGVTTDPVFYMENDKVRTKQTFEVDMDSDPTLQLISSETAADGNESGRIDFIAEALGGKATMASIFATVEDSSTLDGEIQIQIKNGSIDDIVLQADTVNGLSLPIVADGTAGIVSIDANGVLGRTTNSGGGGSDVPDAPARDLSDIEYVLNVPADALSPIAWTVASAAGGSAFTTDVTVTKTDPLLSLISDEGYTAGNEVGKIDFRGRNSDDDATIVYGALTATNDSTLDLSSLDLSLTKTDPTLILRSDENDADDNEVGKIEFYGQNSFSQDTLYGSIGFIAEDVSNDTEDALFVVKSLDQGTSYDIISIGSTNISLGEGNLSAATNTFAVAIGDGIDSGASSSVAIGRSAGATSSGTVSIGRSAIASGANSISLGSFSDATASSSTAIGYLAQATVANTVVLGTSAETVIMPGEATMSGIADGTAGVVGISSTGVLSRVASGGGGGSDVPDTPDKDDSLNKQYILNVPAASNEDASWIENPVSGGTNFTTNIGITKTDPQVNFISDEAPATGNEIGRFNFVGDNADNVADTFARVTVNALDVTADAEEGDFRIFGLDAGTLTPRFTLSNNKVSLGSLAVASGDSSTALGAGTDATGANSTAIGFGAQATVDNTIVIGTASETVIMPGEVTLSGVQDGTAGLVAISATGVLSRGGGDFTTDVSITKTDPNISLVSSETAADLNEIGRVDFKGLNDATTPEEITYGSIYFEVTDVTDGSEDSALVINHFRNSEVEEIIKIEQTSVKIGVDAVASGASSIAIGNTSTGSGTNGVSLGRNTVASGLSTFAGGFAANAAGASSVSIGAGSSATAANSTALGHDAQATAESSVAIGNAAVSDVANQIVLGTSSETTLVPGLAQFKGNTNHLDDPDNVGDNEYNSSAIQFVSKDGDGDNFVGTSIHSYIVNRALDRHEIRFFTDDGGSDDDLRFRIGDDVAFFGDGTFVSNLTNAKTSYLLDTENFVLDGINQLTTANGNIQDNIWVDNIAGTITDKDTFWAKSFNSSFNDDTDTNAGNTVTLAGIRVEYSQSDDYAEGAFIVRSTRVDRAAETNEIFDTQKITAGKVEVFGDTNDDTDGMVISRTALGDIWTLSFSEVIISGSAAIANDKGDTTNDGTDETVRSYVAYYYLDGETYYRVRRNKTDDTSLTGPWSDGTNLYSEQIWTTSNNDTRVVVSNRL